MFVPVLVGSVRRGRNTTRLARFLHDRLAGRDGVTSELVDPQDLDLPLLEERLRYLEDPPEALVRFGATMERADALLITTPEYNKGIPAALKNLLDALGSELRRKAVGVAAHSTGAFGGAYVLQTVRPIVMNLGAVAIPATYNVPHVAQKFGPDGELLDADFDGRTERFLDELLWYARALATARADD